MVQTHVAETIKQISSEDSDVKGRNSSMLAPFARMNTAQRSLYRRSSLQNHSRTSEEEHIDVPVNRKDKVLQLLDSTGLQMCLAFVTVIALFGPDLWILTMPVESDIVLEIVLFITFIIFSMELALILYAKKGYFRSFYFVIDLVATVSILIDISFIWEPIVSATSTVDQQDSLAILRAGRLVRTGTRTTRALRLLKLIRLVRVLRLFRLMRLYNGHLARKYFASHSEKTEQASNNLGQRLADLLGKRVIMGAVLMLLLVPSLEVQTGDNSQLHGLEALEVAFSSLGPNATASRELVDVFVTQQPNLLGLNVANETVLSKNMDKVRVNLVVAYESASGWSQAWFDTIEYEQDQALLNILMTTLLTMLFSLSAYFFNRDVHVNVVRPIVKTTKLIHKLARTLFLLSNDTESKKNEDGLLEGKFIEQVVDQLITFFKVNESPEPRSRPSPGSSRKFTVMPQSALGNSALNLNAVLDQKEIKAREARREMANLVCDSRITVFNSFEEFWKDSQARQFFKVFLTAEFALESLLFVEQIELYHRRWKTIHDLHWDTIRRFVDERSPFQVNISDDKRQNLLDFDGQAFSKELYNSAQAEIFEQLERDNFQRFKASKLAEELVRLKKTQIALSQNVDEPRASPASPTALAEPVKVLQAVRAFSRKLLARKGGPSKSPSCSPNTDPDDGN
mmetsp:Transcript_12207/g.34514  ORF Transcript_12207/g.34514 Transcript_12207/m.34514 type:complete len:682 (+) Transcript_12207:757-2802(+)